MTYNAKDVALIAATLVPAVAKDMDPGTAPWALSRESVAWAIGLLHETDRQLAREGLAMAARPVEPNMFREPEE